jgi:predicted nucleic acid-binding protein
LLLALLADAGHERWADGFVAEEARRNLVAKAPESLEAFEEVLSRIELAPLQPSASLDLPLPEKDRPVLAAAIRLRCDALVTGDRTHFGALYGKAIHGVTIHSPRSLAEKLLLGGPKGSVK